MTAIAPGVRVKCIRPDGPYVSQTDPTDILHGGPSYGSVWTVGRVMRFSGEDFFLLKEWRGRDAFRSAYFVPLDGNEDEIFRLESLIDSPTNPDQPAKRHEILEPASTFLPDAATCLRPSVTEAEGISYPHSALANSCRSDALAPGHTVPIVGPALPPSPRVPLSPVSRWRTGQTRSDPEGRAGLADARVRHSGQSEKPAPFLMNGSASS